MDKFSHIDIFIEDEYIGTVSVNLKSDVMDEIGDARELSEKVRECVCEIIQKNSIKNTFQ